MRRVFVALMLCGALAACAGGEGGEARVQTIEITGGPQRYFVDVVDRGQGNRTLVVRSAGFRGLDRGEGQLAFGVAGQAAAQFDCGANRGIALIPETARFQDDTGNVGPAIQGRNVWIFQGKCGG